MPNSRSAKKALRQNRQRNEHNRQVRSTLRTSLRRVREATASGDADAARAALRDATRTLDKAAKRHIVHRNTAARYQSRLAKRINAIGAAAPAADKS